MWLKRFGVSGGNPYISAIQLLLVGGGGATASATSGGGGGGGFIETYVYNIKNDWPIIIGNGGFNGSSDAYAGKPTSAFGLEAAGGGTGVHALSSPPQALIIRLADPTGLNTIDGGSGGGGFLNFYGPGGLGNTPSYSPTQGYNGGTSDQTAASGGGGGAGGVGSPNNGNVGGNGGNGRISTITGSTVYYAPGGGGYGAGGNGTGGLGTYGRGSTWSGGGQNAGAGIAIIRYKGSSARATGGSISYISGYVIHTFTANGTFSII
jgi:hypothetical protein